VIEIVPIAEADIEAVGAAMARAFWDDPLMARALPDEDERSKRSGPLFVQGIRFSNLVGVTYVPAGILAGAGCGWKLPRPELPDRAYVEAGLEPPDVVLGPEASKRFSTITEFIDEHMFRAVRPPCWYLGSLGVDPAHQNKGIGGALVRVFEDLATADGLPLCLWTANLKNVKFYTGLGFEIMGEGVEPSSDLPYWLFAR
jgi:GNAT superfamily N-acetyltransferase